MPFYIPYGPPISAQRAQAAVQAAIVEANKHDWPMNIAVVDSGANLVAFLRMDGALLASIAVAEHKARTAGEIPKADESSGGCGPEIGLQIRPVR
jgi:uncharacterized protein GlcG (DUF336 family)